MRPTGSPLFGSIELAARVEQAESRTLAAAVAAALRRDPAGGAFALPLGGGFATWAAAGSPLDKVAGLGFGPAIGDDELAEMERRFAERSTPTRLELSSLAEEGLAARFTRRGYQLAGFENVLALPLGPGMPERVADGVEIAEVASGEEALWLDLVVSGFATPDEQGVSSDEQFPREVIEQAIGDFVAAEGFRRYLARRAGDPAGGASMRLVDGIAQLAGAATVPIHRRRGVQSSLLAARLRDALAAGCDVAVVTTQPGSKSQENVQRLGFHLLYTRAVLVLETP